MSKLRTIGLAAGLAIAAGAASASTITFTDSQTSSGNIINFTSNPNDLTQELTFIGTAPFFAYQNFTVGRAFSLTLEDYQPTNSGGAQSYFALYTDSATYTGPTNCTTGGVIASIDGMSCTSVNGLNGTAGSPPPITFSGLAAGDYTLAFYENGAPINVQADFVISAVPVPASLPLLVAGLGGIAALRRRKKKAA